MVSTQKDVVNRLQQLVRKALRTALPHGGHVAVGYSGGPDSTVLLLLASQQEPDKINVSAIHVNHQLQPQAANWEKHCRNRCAKLGVELHVAHAQVSRTGSLEDQARQARMAAFRNLDADAILLAHHADDQAETVLLRALRGAGMRGLAAMRTQSQLQHSTKLLLRPLLEISRSELAAAARQLRVRGIKDPTNTDQQHNRNWLRHTVVPAAEQRFPGATAALTKLAHNAAQADHLLAELAELDDAEATTVRGLSRARLQRNGLPRVINWLSWHLARRGLPAPTSTYLSEAARQICAAKRGLHLQFAMYELVSRNDHLQWRESGTANTRASIGKIDKREHKALSPARVADDRL